MKKHTIPILILTLLFVACRTKQPLILTLEFSHYSCFDIETGFKKSELINESHRFQIPINSKDVINGDILLFRDGVIANTYKIDSESIRRNTNDYAEFQYVDVTADDGEEFIFVLRMDFSNLSLYNINDGIACSYMNYEEDTDIEKDSDSYYLDKIISNFYKYKDEDSLFNGLFDDGYKFGLLEMEFTDTLLIFNFEKGTVQKVKRFFGDENDPYRVLEFSSYIKGMPTERTVTGDFDGCGKKETFIVENYEQLLQANSSDTVFYLVCLDKKLPKLRLWGCLDEFTINNIGDIDDDGRDELGFMPQAGCSSCKFYWVFTLLKDRWEEILLIETTRDMRATGILPIVKDPNQKGIVYIRFPEGCCQRASYVIEATVKAKELKEVKDTHAIWPFTRMSMDIVNFMYGWSD